MTSSNKIATFNLREAGPLTPDAIGKRMVGGFRLATKHGDPKATLDPHPCPHCRAKVEWSATSKLQGGKVERYVYARCQGSKMHSWSFRNRADEVAATDPKPVDVTVPIKGTHPDVLTAWIDGRLREIEAELHKLSEIRRLANEVKHAEPDSEHAHH